MRRGSSVSSRTASTLRRRPVSIALTPRRRPGLASAVVRVIAMRERSTAPQTTPAGRGSLWKLYGSLSRPDPTHSHPQNDAKMPAPPTEIRKRPAAARARPLMVGKGSPVRVRSWAWLCRAISSPLQPTVSSAMEALWRPNDSPGCAAWSQVTPASLLLLIPRRGPTGHGARPCTKQPRSTRSPRHESRKPTSQSSGRLARSLKKSTLD
jgi:hypothetical protein